MNCYLQKHTTHQFTYFIYYSIPFELKVEIGFSGEPMTQYTRESCANVNHMRT